MSRVSSEVSVIDRKTTSLKKVIHRTPNARFFLEHNRGYFYFITNHNSQEFKLIRVPVGSSLSHSETILDGGLCIDEVDMYDENFIVYYRSQGKAGIKIYEIPTGKLKDIPIDKPDSVYSIQPGSNLDYNAKNFTVTYSSPTVYEETLSYSFETSKLTTTNSKKIIGAPLKLNNFVTTRVSACSYDGVPVPITLFHHKDIKKDRKNRLLVKGYGAYGAKHDYSFKYSEAAAVEEGWVIANAHVRGDGECGISWHKAGTKEKKYNSFQDMIACVSYLIQESYTHPKYIAGYGTSAGGLLMAQVLNLKPLLFAAMVLEVPFVDPLSEMLNQDLPLSITDRDEWGDPLKVLSMQDPNIFNEMASYAPYDNLTYAEYPPMLVTGSINDSRVSFYSILKYIKRLRNKAVPRNKQNICSQNIALDIQDSGHFGQGNLESEAVIWGFLNKIIPIPGI